jgi:hypothetical protein
VQLGLDVDRGDPAFGHATPISMNDRRANAHQSFLHSTRAPSIEHFICLEPSVP